MLMKLEFTYPTGVEPFVLDVDPGERYYVNAAVAKAIEGRRLTTSRRNPQPVTGQLYHGKLVNGTLLWEPAGTFSEMPPRTIATAEDYTIESKQILSVLPTEFRNPLLQYADEKGHAAGYDACLDVLNSMVELLRQPIADFYSRITRHPSVNA